MMNDDARRLARLEDEISSMRRSVLMCLKAIMELRDIVELDTPTLSEEAIELFLNPAST